MAIIRIITRWSGGLVVGGGITQLYFGQVDGTEQDAADAVGVFWDALEDTYSNQVSWAMDAQVAIFDETDGSLMGATTVTPAGPGAGTRTTNALPPSNQGLVQWSTAEVHGNRLVRGRTFLPGMLEENSTAGGAPESFYIDTVAAAAQALVDDADSGLVIWARPIGSRPGAAGFVTQASVWDKFAVLRGRRD